MTIEPADLSGRPGPVYRALADALSDAIAEGRLAPGARLPPQRDLAFRLDVTVGTVGRAYELLAQRGLVRGEVGRGTYVLGQIRSIELPPSGPTAPGSEGLIDLTANFPAPIPAQARLGELLPTGESAVDVLADLLRYPEVVGAARHRAEAAAWLAHLGLSADPERLILTNGTESGLAAALLALARPGDCILAEALCYGGLRNLAARLGQHLEPVAMDEQGIVPEALAAAARHTGARVLVTSLNLHNPTGLVVPPERREALVAVARAADLLLVEDDVYGPLVPDRPPGFATLAPERTLHLTSLSKFLAPGLRLGFLHGPERLVREVTAAQREISLGYAPLAAELFVRAHRAGVVAEALRQQRLELGERQRLAREILTGFALTGQPTALHVWLGLPEPWTSAEAALALARAGILLTPAERFFIGRGAAPRAVRISLSAAPTRTHLKSALQRIVATLAHAAGLREGSLV
ncbi:PLP-dependent aminotransferase family protein [Benzoatithermus flavus]|uniref:PLP-dependent aminotransferase family protein n=1 Tax=Benzoatithermus flavus TaxID=3108223 RepID=A0ABU8XWP2_9PROT